jgi:hypothetical protein
MKVTTHGKDPIRQFGTENKKGKTKRIHRIEKSGIAESALFW